MTIFILREDITIGEPILLNREKSHYLLKVMRCRVGDALFVIDGRGGRYEAVVHGLSEPGALLVIKRKIAEDKHPYNTVLCQSILKGSSMDEVIEQSVEIGIREIQPIITERTIVRDTNKLQRWRKIAEEASEQSGRSHLPVIHAPLSLAELVNSFVSLKNAEGLVFIKEGADMQQTLRGGIPKEHYFLLLGPEGGFTDKELSVLSEIRFKPVTLGKLTLRARTASTIAVALTHYFINLCNSIE